MDIRESARKHGIADADIRHALDYFRTIVEQDYDGETRILVIGPARDGSLLELIVVPADEPTRVIHADNLRPKFYRYL